MKKNRKIYSLLLTLVFACLMLVQASCSNDIAEPTPEQVPGGTYLTIVTRGIVTGDGDKSNYEDYVGSLRVIAFKNGQVVLNKKLTELPQGNIDDTEVDITEEGETILLSSGGGFYTFYFIANEEGHNVVGGSDLSTALAEGTITAASQLENMQVQFTVEEIKAPTTFGNNTTYMLMSTKQTIYIEEGEDQTIEVVLDRALAKANLIVRKEQSSQTNYGTITASISHSQIPAKYALMKGATVDGLTYLSDGSTTLTSTTLSTSENGYTNLYECEYFYLPEYYLAENTSTNALKYTISANNRTYSAPIGDDDVSPADYNIYRNYAYTTVGTFVTPVTLTSLTFSVDGWGIANIVPPAFE
mgnify:CR=1 FL=1